MTDSLNTVVVPCLICNHPEEPPGDYGPVCPSCGNTQYILVNVPSEWKLVPKEPTMEQQDEMFKAIHNDEEFHGPLTHRIYEKIIEYTPYLHKQQRG